MHARILLLALLVSMLTLSAPAEPRPGAAGAAIRITATAAELPWLSAERRMELALNPEDLAPAELNRRIPEIDAAELDNSIADAETGQQLRLVAWNIERGRAWERAAKLIAHHPAMQNPDVLFLSEMDRGMKRSGNVHTTRELARALGMNYAYAVEFIELPRGESREDKEAHAEANTWGYHGNAILSRFPLHRVRALRFPGGEQWYGGGEHRLGGRNAVLAEIETGEGQRVTLVSTHLESGFSDGPVRAHQTRLILGEIEAHAQGQPVLIGGDMNSFHGHAAIAQYREAGFEVDAANLLEEGTSQRARDGKVVRGGFHIDYLIVRGVEIIKHEHSPGVVLATWPNTQEGKLLSDHAAVTLDVRLAPGP